MADLRCGASLAKVFLVIFNLLFVLIGLALVVGGALLKAGADVLDLLGEFVKQVPGLEQIATVVIGLGCAIFIIGVLGMCGACCNIRCMLVLYALVVLFLTLAEGVLVTLLFTGKLDHTIRKGLGTLTSKYKAPDVSNIDQTDLSSRLVDGLYISLKCCDYNNDTGVDFPPSCCKNVTRSALNAGDIKDLAACVSSPDHTNSNIDKDCLDAIMDIIRANQSYSIGVGVGILVIELLCVFFHSGYANSSARKTKSVHYE